MSNSEISWLSWFFSIGVWKERFSGIQKRITDLPDNLRIATLTSWRDKERGLSLIHI